MERKITSLRAKVFLAICFAFAVYFYMPFTMPEPARRVTFIFVLAALFWAFEIIPLYATSLLVIFLEIALLGKPGGVLGFDASGYVVFLAPFGSPIIILFFGGFILATALHKYQIDKWIATRLLNMFGNKPYFLMLGFMITTAVLSMWMSDTATTAMMIAMVLPFLNQLEKDDPFKTALILSVPFSALIGGMCTPVGTPPNAIAIGLLADKGIHINFIDWMKMAVPLAVLLLLIASFVLISLFKPLKDKLNLKIKPEGKLDSRTIGIIYIALVTIGLWLTSGIHGMPSSVVALLAAVMCFVTNLLDRNDLKSINWDVLILMWGGLSLGKGMEISGLTKWIVDLPFFEQQGFILVAAFCVLAVFLSTFMSNTATANLLIPIVMVIPNENPIILATVIALSCSLAMILPVSTPPNAIAFSTEMLKSKDMVKAGMIISIISVIMILLGFQFIIPLVLGV